MFDNDNVNLSKFMRSYMKRNKTIPFIKKLIEDGTVHKLLYKSLVNQCHNMDANLCESTEYIYNYILENYNGMELSEEDKGSLFDAIDRYVERWNVSLEAVRICDLIELHGDSIAYLVNTAQI